MTFSGILAKLWNSHDVGRMLEFLREGVIFVTKDLTHPIPLLLPHPILSWETGCDGASYYELSPSSSPTSCTAGVTSCRSYFLQELLLAGVTSYHQLVMDLTRVR